MSIRKILIFGDPLLKEQSKEVSKVDQKVRELIKDMFDTMYNAPGVGLAAPQIGVLARVIAFDVAKEIKKGTEIEKISDPKAIINPKILSRKGKISCKEGCLSVPEYEVEIPRSEEIEVIGLDENGNEIKLYLAGFPAIVAQHEIDHLDGKLIIDGASRIKKSLYKNKLKKRAKKI